MHESKEVFKAGRNASWVESRELAENWPRTGRELSGDTLGTGEVSPEQKVGLGFVNN